MAKKWIQKAVKREGRFKGKSKEDLRGIVNRLKNKKNKTKADVSEERAAQLGIRFKSREFKKNKKPAMPRPQ